VVARRKFLPLQGIEIVKLSQKKKDFQRDICPG
jgi:hypothetical protein